MFLLPLSRLRGQSRTSIVSRFTIPDLVPVARNGLTGAQADSYCVQDAAGNLLVRVRNQGLGPAQRPTVTRVTILAGPFTSARVIDQLTPALQPGQEAVLVFATGPIGQNFTITVDATGALTEEVNKANNTVTGTCLFLR